MYSTKVSRHTILKWEKKFGALLHSFSLQFILDFSLDTHADEMFAKPKGAAVQQFHYYWAAIDRETKFIVADHVSEERNEIECSEFLRKIRGRIKEPIVHIHTDNSYDYPRPIRRIFGKKTVHVHVAAWRHKFQNNPIERLYNTVREVTKTLRRFTTLENLQSHMRLKTVYYNFIRPHKSLLGRTPAEAAGFGRWNWWTIIKIDCVTVSTLMIS
jgi:transposase-like protein